MERIQHASNPHPSPGHELAWFQSRDAFALVSLGLLAVWLTATATVLPPTIQMDNLSYLQMVDTPFDFSGVRGIHAQRPLPCWIVAAITRVTPLSPTAGFRLISGASYLAFLLLFYVTLRASGCRISTAWTGSVLCGISAWPMTYNLSNVYQACDAMAFPLSLLLMWAVIGGRHRSALAFGIIGLLTRQQLFLLAILGYTYAYSRSRNPIHLASIAITSCLFAILVLVAGEDGAGLLHEHTSDVLTRFQVAGRALMETRLPVLFSPFLLVLLVAYRSTWEAIRTNWWIAVFCLACLIQPLLAYEMTGPGNAVRLAMLGVWPALWWGARITDQWLAPGWPTWVYMTLPGLYGTAHLVSQQQVFPSPLGHRFVVNIILLALVMFSARRPARVNNNPRDEEQSADQPIMS